MSIRSNPISTIEDLRNSQRIALTLAEVASLLEVDPRTVSSALTAGSIPSVRLGRRVLVPREPFLALFDTYKSLGVK